MEKPVPLAVTGYKALSIPALSPAEQCIVLELSIFRLRIIEGEMQPAALFSTQG